MRGLIVDRCCLPLLITLKSLNTPLMNTVCYRFKKTAKSTQNNSFYCIIFQFLNNQIMINCIECFTKVKKKQKLPSY